MICAQANGALVGALAPGEVMVELEQAVTEDVARYAATGAGESYFGSRIQDLVCARGAWLAALLVLQLWLAMRIRCYQDRAFCQWI